MSGAVTGDLLRQIFDEFKNEAGRVPFDKVSAACISANPSFKIDRIRERIAETEPNDEFDFPSFQTMYVDLCRQEYFFDRPYGKELEHVFEECFWLTPEELRDILEAFDMRSNLADGTIEWSEIPAILAACNMANCKWDLDADKPVHVSDFVSMVAAHKLGQYFTERDAEVVSKYFPTDTTKCSLADLSRICEDLGMSPFDSEEVEALQLEENAGQFDHADTWLLFARRRLLEGKQMPELQSLDKTDELPGLDSAKHNGFDVANAEELNDVDGKEHAAARKQAVRERVEVIVERLTWLISIQSVEVLHSVVDFSDGEISALAEFVDGVPAADLTKINSSAIPEISPTMATRIPTMNGVVPFESVVVLWLLQRIGQAQDPDAAAGDAEAHALGEAASSVASFTTAFRDKPTKSASSTSDPEHSHDVISGMTSPDGTFLPLLPPTDEQGTLATLADELRDVLLRPYEGEGYENGTLSNAVSLGDNDSGLGMTPCEGESAILFALNTLVPRYLVFILGINAIEVEVEELVVRQLFKLYNADRTPQNFVWTLKQVGIDQGVAREYTNVKINTFDDFSSIFPEIMEVSSTLDQYEQCAFWMSFKDFDSIYDAVTNNRVRKFLMEKDIKADNLPAWHRTLRQRLDLLSDALARVTSKTLLEAVPAPIRAIISREFQKRGGMVASLQDFTEVVVEARYAISVDETDLISSFLSGRGTHLTLEDALHFIGRQKLRTEFIYENARENNSDAQQVFGVHASGGVLSLDELVECFALLGVPLCSIETQYIKQSATQMESDLVDFDAFMNLLREKARGYCPPAEDVPTRNKLMAPRESEESPLLPPRQHQPPSSPTQTSVLPLREAQHPRAAAATAVAQLIEQERVKRAEKSRPTNHRMIIGMVLIGISLVLGILILHQSYFRNSVGYSNEL
eukprot:GEMP01012544.1.p1 GENE.GEMP01012544.1~~GEMP01012544.1.p1  ORF type:complete len:920 (+),score=211.79 GEMP01012544.1:167-2926(+)